MLKRGLEKFLSHEKIAYIQNWIQPYPVKIKIKYGLKTKLGSYRKTPQVHEIMVAGDQTEDLFFLTFTHEIAHMLARETYGKHIQPHGKEWKNTFKNLILESIHQYDTNLQPLILQFSKSPKANFYSFAPLAEYFHKKENPEQLFLKDLADGSLFKLGNNVFKKEKKIKIKYLCTKQSNGTKYRIHGLAPVEKIESYENHT